MKIGMIVLERLDKGKLLKFVIKFGVNEIDIKRLGGNYKNLVGFCFYIITKVFMNLFCFMEN